MKIPYLISLSFSIIIISYLYDFNEKTSNARHKEIIEVVKVIIKDTEIKINFPDFKIYAKLPKYISRRRVDEFIPGPRPNSPYLFPDIEQILKSEMPNYTISNNDLKFFKEQEESNFEIWLNQKDFSEYILAVKGDPIPNEYVYFSIPVFNFDKSIAVVHFGFFCGGECGWVGDVILKKDKTDKWRIFKEMVYWVS